MRRHYMVWLSNFLAIAVLAFGVWWFMNHMAEMPDYRLLSGLTALTCFAMNHLRWWKLAAKVGDLDLAGKIDYLMVVNYLAIVLALALVDFRP